MKTKESLAQRTWLRSRFFHSHTTHSHLLVVFVLPMDQPQAEALSGLRNSLLQDTPLIITVAIITIAVAFYIFYSLKQTKHLRRLVTNLEQQVEKLEDSQSALQASEDRYRDLYNRAPIMMHSLTLDGEFVDVNDQWLHTMGYTRGEVIGRTLYEFMTEESVQYAREQVLPGFLEQGELDDIPYQFVNKNQEIIEVLVTSAAHYDNNGQFAYSFTIVHDVTERKRIQAESLRSREMLDSALATMPDGFAIFDEDDRLVLCNEKYRRIFSGIYDLIVPGVSFHTLVEASKEVDQITQEAFNHSDDYMELRRATQAAGEVIEYQTSDGLWIEARDHAIDGGGWAGIRIDVTARKRIENQLRQNEERLQAVFDAMPDMIFRLNTEGVILDYRAEHQNQLAMPAAEIIGSKLLETPMPAEVVQKLLQFIDQTVTTTQMSVYEYDLQLPIGRQTFETRIIKSGPDEIISFVRNVTERKRAEEALQRSEALLSATNQIARTGGWEFDLQTNELYWTDTIKEIHGVSPDYVPDVDKAIEFYAPEHVPIIQKAVEGAMNGEAYDIELQIITKQQKRLWVRTIGRPVTENGEIIKLHGIFQDIHARKLADEALRQSEERLQVIFNNAPVGIVVTSLSGQLQQVNGAMCQTTGYSREELLTMSIADLTHPPDLPASRKLLQSLMRGEVPGFEMEKQYVCKDGRLIMGILRCAPIQDAAGEAVALIGQLVDITERKQSEFQIIASLQEKEVLLKEIHHRVKNNLQVISSLLDLQSAYIEDAAMQAMLQDSRSRVRSMALVHEQLYGSLDLARIDLQGYLQDLVGYLRRAYNQQVGGVQLRVEVEESLLLDVETAVPLGLIVNELVSNALKHAFPDGRSGEVRIQVWLPEKEQACLIVQDDGIGFPQEIDIHRSPSLGLTIITTLVEQLRGQIDLRQQDGTCFEFYFPLPTINNVTINGRDAHTVAPG